MVTLLIRTVTVPRTTQDHTARTEVQLHTTRQQVVQETYVQMVVVVSCCLQTVVQPVRMEEHVVIHLHMLTVSVPMGIQDPSARTEVTTAHNFEL